MKCFFSSFFCKNVCKILFPGKIKKGKKKIIKKMSPENKTSSDPNYRVTLKEVWDSRARAPRRSQQTRIRGRMRSRPTPHEQRTRTIPHGLPRSHGADSKAAEEQTEHQGVWHRATAAKAREGERKRREAEAKSPWARRHPVHGGVSTGAAPSLPSISAPLPAALGHGSPLGRTRLDRLLLVRGSTAQPKTAPN